MGYVQVIKNLADFINEINDIDIKNEPMKNRLLFRGHSNKEYELMPNIGRRFSKTWVNSLLTVERRLIETVQRRFPLVFPNMEYPVLLLAKLQHYGIPTRMMDLTENALVALYFACKNTTENGEPKDGEVICFSSYTVSAFNSYANVIADTYRLTDNAQMEISNYIYRVRTQNYYVNQLMLNFKDDIAKEKPRFKKYIETPIFLEVGNVCERQVNQRGYFIIFPNELRKHSDENINIIDKIIPMEKENKKIIKRLIIPHEIKKTLVSQLERCGINDDFIFPDNIDYVCKNIVSEIKNSFPDDYIIGR